jgi:hypothetical protein
MSSHSAPGGTLKGIGWFPKPEVLKQIKAARGSDELHVHISLDVDTSPVRDTAGDDVFDRIRA